jgi:hypothetical protein
MIPSTGDTVSDLIRQIPIGLILNVCISAALLTAALVYFWNKRRQNERNKAMAQAQSESEVAQPMTVPPSPIIEPTQRIDTGELPDLDMLLSSPLAEEPPKRAAIDGTYSVKLNTGETVEAREVLAILRDSSDGRLIVQMGDTAYRSLASAPEAKQSFTKLVKELADVITKPDTAAPAQPKEEEPVTQPAEPPQQEELEPKAKEEPVAQLGELAQEPAPKPRVSAPPPVNPSGAMPGDLPSFKLEHNPMPQVKGGIIGRQKFVPQAIPEINIPAAIEAYLQHKLQYTPEYGGRSIHVRSAPGGGVRIEVDGKFYDAVGDVAEEDVRTFLSETIQEWQERQ